MRSFNFYGLMSPEVRSIVTAEIFETDMETIEIPREEQLEIIERHFYEEAAAYREAGETLRTVFEHESRVKALGERFVRLDRINALLDAHNDLNVGLLQQV